MKNVSTETKVKVYAGLSLDEHEVHSVIPNAIFAPAIKRGDTLIDIRHGTHVIVIIDGRFQQSMAVSPTELMDALRCGVRIYGSSSMGAMRAAELEPYGMIGHGKIFEYIKDTAYFRDDYLGQVFTSGKHKSKSEPYVNFMFSLLDMLEKNEIDQQTYDVLEPMYRALHFSERDLYTLIDKIREDHPNGEKMLVNIAKKAFSKHNQKREDGMGLLARVKSDLQYLTETNEKIRSMANEIPQYPGLYPNQEQYEKEVAEHKVEQKRVRASYFADYIKASAELPAMQNKKNVETKSREEEP
jgi:hypothetical protein